MKPTSKMSSSSSFLCKNHSSSETLDILIIILALLSATFLSLSCLSYILHSLSLLKIPLFPLSLLLALALALFLIPKLITLPSSKNCSDPRCRRLEKSFKTAVASRGEEFREFDLKIQDEECLREGGDGVREVDKVGWKGGYEENPDYEVLREELRKMAPVNGRAVLLFRARCGCAVAKLEGWGEIVKRGRKHKKGLALSGGNHR